MTKDRYPSHAPTPVKAQTSGDPYNSREPAPSADVVEFTLPDTIEVITLCSEAP